MHATRCACAGCLLIAARHQLTAVSAGAGSSASAAPSTTTRSLPSSTQRVSNTARRPVTRVTRTVACSRAPTGAVPRNARLCVRYSAPGWRDGKHNARHARQLSAPRVALHRQGHGSTLAPRTRREPMMAGNKLAISTPGGKHACRPAACAAACSRAAMRTRRQCAAAWCTAARRRPPHQLRVYGVGVARQRREGAHIVCRERASLLVHGANLQQRERRTAVARRRAARACSARAVNKQRARAPKAHAPARVQLLAKLTTRQLHAVSRGQSCALSAGGVQ